MDHAVKSSPFQSFINNLPNLQLPQGHNKPLKHAFYNSIALLILCLACTILWAVFCILNPFLKPLIWALLVGSVLHPFKNYVSQQIRVWFADIETKRTSFIVAFCMLPFAAIDTVSDFIGKRLINYVQLVLILSFVILSMHLCYFYSPAILIDGVVSGFATVNASILFVIDSFNSFIITTCFIGYAIIVVSSMKYTFVYKYGSYFLWFLMSVVITNQFSVLKVPVFLLTQIVYFIGFLIQFNQYQAAVNQYTNRTFGLHDFIAYLKMNYSEREKQLIELKSLAVTVKSMPDSEHSELEPLVSRSLSTSSSQIDQMKSFTHEPLLGTSAAERKLYYRNSLTNLFQLTASSLAVRNYLKRCNNANNCSLSLIDSNLPFNQSEMSGGGGCGSSSNVLNDSSMISSEHYLYLLFWLFGITIVRKNILLLALVPLLIVVYVIKMLGNYFGLWSRLKSNGVQCSHLFLDWLAAHQDAFVSNPLIGLRIVFVQFSDWFVRYLIDSIDMISTSFVLICLAVFFMFAMVFMAVQVYSEGIILIQIMSNVFNKSVIYNPNLSQFLPPNLDETFDSIFDNAYIYGREGLSRFVRNTLNDTETTKLDKIENQILELWDRIYQTWMSTAIGTDSISNDGSNSVSIGPRVDSTAIVHSWNEFVNDVSKSPEVFNVRALFDFCKQNLGTFLAFGQSVLVLLKGNLALILTSCTTFVSIVFGGSSVVLNFLINLVVFVTTLFYLLSSSTRAYKPVDFVTKLSPYYGNRFAVALEGAVNDVFNATFKMTLFYGLWTWIIHNLFAVKIVFIPSVLAAILGAIPFLGTYWACVPAVLDLWLAQNCPVKAVLFALCQIAPTYVVDTTIYMEIKGGGHPYLTGLAIAGGIFCLGPEGAIFGPLLLCGLYVALNLSSDFIRDPTNN